MLTRLILPALIAILAISVEAQTKDLPKNEVTLELYTLNCGHFVDLDRSDFSEDGAYKGVGGEMANPCFLIRHSKGDLLWDLGLPESFVAVEEGIEDPFFPSRMFVTKRLTDQLSELGLEPSDIEFISVSHSHFDHISNANLFAEHSTWIVDEDERSYAFDDERRGSSIFKYYDLLENAKTILIKGETEFDVFGDGSVLMIQAPGHTPGHTVLLVDLPEAGPVLITGDLWHIRESREKRRVPVFNTDRDQTLASMDKIEALIEKKGARVVLQHVKEDIDALPAFPKPLR